MSVGPGRHFCKKQDELVICAFSVLPMHRDATTDCMLVWAALQGSKGLVGQEPAQ